MWQLGHSDFIAINSGVILNQLITHIVLLVYLNFLSLLLEQLDFFYRLDKVFEPRKAFL